MALCFVGKLAPNTLLCELVAIMQYEPASTGIVSTVLDFFVQGAASGYGVLIQDVEEAAFEPG
jgi:hypothetical protein